MLKTTPGNLWAEVKAAEDYRDKHLKGLKSRIRRFHGPAFKGKVGDAVDGDGDPEETDPENHAFEWISQVVPRMAWDNPRVSMKTSRPGLEARTVDAIKRGCNRWTRDVNLHKDLEAFATDYSFAWFGAMVTNEPREGMHQSEDPVMWPQVYRLSFRDMFFDPLAKTFEGARYVGHKFTRDLDDLIEEAKENPNSGWNLEALHRLVPNESETKKFHAGEGDTNGAQSTPDRGEVLLFEVWVPEHELDNSPGPEEGFYGTIFTLINGESAMEADGEEDEDGNWAAKHFIRKPRPFFGYRGGPYVYCGAYHVSDSPYKMSPIVATEAQAKDVNDHARASKRSADGYKKIVLIDNAMDPELASKIKNAPDSFVVPVAGLDKNAVHEVEIGGLSDTQLKYLMVTRERLERNSGMHEALTGATSGATATEVAAAESASRTRMGHIDGNFAGGIKEIYKRVAFYLYRDDDIVFPLSGEDAEDLSMNEPWFHGGGGDGTGYSFDDLEIDIEPYSMSRISEAILQQQVMQLVEIVTSLAPMVPQLPYVQWKRVFQAIGERMGLEDIESFVDVDAALAMAGAPAQADPWATKGMVKKQFGTKRLADQARQRQGGDPRVTESGAFPRAMQEGGGLTSPGRGGGGIKPTSGAPGNGGMMALKGQLDQR